MKPASEFGGVVKQGIVHLRRFRFEIGGNEPVGGMLHFGGMSGDPEFDDDEADDRQAEQKTDEEWQEVANDGNFEARARNRSVVIQQADACTMNGFEELLRSAVENVVRNAIRHTAEGTAVEISLQAGNSRALLRMWDHGPGVPDAMLSEIFLPFRRVANGNSDGAGLGLAIAERAVGVHGGTIRALNAPQGGLIVEIDLPLR